MDKDKEELELLRKVVKSLQRDLGTNHSIVEEIAYLAHLGFSREDFKKFFKYADSRVASAIARYQDNYPVISVEWYSPEERGEE